MINLKSKYYWFGKQGNNGDGKIILQALVHVFVFILFLNDKIKKYKNSQLEIIIRWRWSLNYPDNYEKLLLLLLFFCLRPNWYIGIENRIVLFT